MKTSQRSFRLIAAALLFTASAFIISCSKNSDDPISADVKASISNESSQDAQQDEIDDMATSQLNVADPSGREAGTPDGRTTCAYITFSFNNQDQKTAGSLTIDFDKNKNGEANPSGCTDANGNTRKGQIVVTWSTARWFKAGSSLTITLNNYSINGVVITGTRTWTNVTSNIAVPTWTVAASHTSTWPDKTTATRVVAKTRAWDILNGTLTMSQTAGAAAAASGTNRNGKVYTVQITTALVYSINCALTSKVYIPVSGVKVFTFNTSSVATLDFGAGTCDNTFTVNFSGKTDTETVTND